MDKIQLLQERKAKLAEVQKSLKADISAIVDEDSFVELSAFSFSKNDFYGEDVVGEGVMTGFGTIDGYPFYIVAQNFNVLNGGMSKANCDKIVKCLNTAVKNDTPVIYLLNTQGVQVGEGVTVLEGLSNVLSTSIYLKNFLPQYVVINGEVYGSIAALASIATATFFVEKKSVLALNSPFVLSAKAGKNLTKEEVGGLNALNKTMLPAVAVQDLSEAKAKILALTELHTNPVTDAELNEAVPVLNENVTAENMLSILESPVEIGATMESDVKTVFGRIGGISVATVLFDGGEEGVELTERKLAKIKKFVKTAKDYELPLVVFGNVKGICPCTCANNSRVLNEVAEYLEAFWEITTPKIAVVYKKAIGLGYSLFAAKSIGFDYSCAFANAKIALFDDAAGAQIEFGSENVDKNAIVAKYAEENSDPINAAKDGYIDAIIEPQFVKQYLISSLQMLLG